MTESLYYIFGNLFENNVILATILIAMLPIIELKGAIPFATNEIIWGNLAISNWQALGWSLLGCSMVVPILALTFRSIIQLLKSIKPLSKIGNAVEQFALSKSRKTDSYDAGKFSYIRKLLFVFIFVALPFPLTGVWTGTCIAICMNIDFFSTCASVILGNILAGIVITLILEFFPILNNYLFFIFLAIVSIYLIVKLIRHHTSNSPNRLD